MVDPRHLLQGDVEAYADQVGPLDRARMRGELAEAAEERQRLREQDERAGRAEAALMALEARERTEVLTTGHTSRQLREMQATEAALRDERIQELEAQLTKLDPVRARASRAAAQRAELDAEHAALIRRARQAGRSPFMRDAVRALERRQADDEAALYRAQVARAEADWQAARSWESDYLDWQEQQAAYAERSLADAAKAAKRRLWQAMKVIESEMRAAGRESMGRARAHARVLPGRDLVREAANLIEAELRGEYALA